MESFKEWLDVYRVGLLTTLYWMVDFYQDGFYLGPLIWFLMFGLPLLLPRVKDMTRRHPCSDGLVCPINMTVILNIVIGTYVMAGCILAMVGWGLLLDDTATTNAHATVLYIVTLLGVICGGIRVLQTKVFLRTMP